MANKFDSARDSSKTFLGLYSLDSFQEILNQETKYFTHVIQWKTMNFNPWFSFLIVRRFQKNANHFDFYRSSNSSFSLTRGSIPFLNVLIKNFTFVVKKLFQKTLLRGLIQNSESLKRFQNVLILLNLLVNQTVLFSGFSWVWVFPSMSHSKTYYLRTRFSLKNCRFGLLRWTSRSRRSNELFSFILSRFSNSYFSIAKN